MEKPKLYILTGIPFAGKTTLGKEIFQTIPATFISIDDIGLKQIIEVSGEKIKQTTFDMLHKIAAERAQCSLIAGNIVIYDSTIYKVTREYLRLVARECKAEAIIIFVSTPREEAYRRWEKNRTTLERHSPHPASFAKFTESFEPPDNTEKHVVFHADDNIAKWIKHNI